MVLAAAQRFDVSPAPLRILTYQEHKMVRVFVFLAKRAGAGATRRELASVAGLSVNSPQLRSLMDAMCQRGFVTVRVDTAAPRAPFRYWVSEEAWQVKHESVH